MWARVSAAILTVPLLGLAPPASAAPALDWQPCAPKSLRGFQCSSLTVPKDYADPAKGTFELAVVRLPATGKKKGTLFFNPGGPGVASVPLAPAVASALPKKLRKRFDFVTWDPRGVGSSSGLECEGGEYDLPATGPVDWDRVMDAMRASEGAANAACAAKYPNVVPYIGTNSTVRDLESLRAAVGDKKLTYWGTSYGTRIGYVYAHQYPRSVRAMILSSSIDPDGTWPEFAFGSGIGPDTALGLLFEAYPGSAKHYRRAMKALNQRALDLPSGQFTRWHVGLPLVDGSSSDSDYKGLASFLKTVDKATHGDKKARQALNKMGPWPAKMAINGGAIPYIGCSDYPQRMTAPEQNDLARRIRATAPIVGYGTSQATVYCEGISITPDPVPVSFVNWRTPMLIMGSTRDALTPYAWTANMARVFKNSRVVTLVGGTHTPLLAGSKCMDRWGIDYLLNLKRPRVDVACPAVLP